MAKTITAIRPRSELLQEFYNSPPDALFPQEPIAAVLDCSPAKLERERWEGGGIPFLKIGRNVRYRKRDVLDWLNRCPVVSSTTEADLARRGG